MNLLFSFLEPKHSHSTMLAGYFSKVVVCLMLRKTIQLMSYVEEGGDNLDAQIESLLNVEKQSRLLENVYATKKAVIDIIQLILSTRAWKTLNEADPHIVQTKRPNF
ncbi:hypothetical protein IFM89_031235 [Coptis chinensis]|uniref:Uncharacterized protein n=1 Tax=Coptis chinensis TaxID=261450 RepID=A0A835MAH0_9MAGN|nr:hypothetical protein IFM89_031235 [Coptis chinensis]